MACPLCHGCPRESQKEKGPLKWAVQKPFILDTQSLFLALQSYDLILADKLGTARHRTAIEKRDLFEGYAFSHVQIAPSW
jgi:hypothetical protein